MTFNPFGHSCFTQTHYLVLTSALFYAFNIQMTKSSHSASSVSSASGTHFTGRLRQRPRRTRRADAFIRRLVLTHDRAPRPPSVAAEPQSGSNGSRNICNSQHLRLRSLQRCFFGLFPSPASRLAHTHSRPFLMSAAICVHRHQAQCCLMRS